VNRGKTIGHRPALVQALGKVEGGELAESKNRDHVSAGYNHSHVMTITIYSIHFLLTQNGPEPEKESTSCDSPMLHSKPQRFYAWIEWGTA
jgi:hypothetical protein